MGRAQGSQSLEAVAGTRSGSISDSTGEPSITRCFKGETLYHATPLGNIGSIEAEGLRANSYLWLNSDMAHEFCEEYLPHGYGMFEVSTDAALHPDGEFEEFEDGHEAWCCPQAIPAQGVTFIGVYGVDDDDEYWDEE